MSAYKYLASPLGLSIFWALTLANVCLRYYVAMCHMWGRAEGVIRRLSPRPDRGVGVTPPRGFS